MNLNLEFDLELSHRVHRENFEFHCHLIGHDSNIESFQLMVHSVFLSDVR